MPFFKRREVMKVNIPYWSQYDGCDRSDYWRLTDDSLHVRICSMRDQGYNEREILHCLHYLRFCFLENFELDHYGFRKGFEAYYDLMMRLDEIDADIRVWSDVVLVGQHYYRQLSASLQCDYPFFRKRDIPMKNWMKFTVLLMTNPHIVSKKRRITLCNH